MKNKQQSVKPADRIILLIFSIFNMVGRVLRFIGIRVGDANAEVIIRKAMVNSEIKNIIDDSFREPLDVLVQSANQQPSFKPMGRIAFRNLIMERVSNRLQIDATLAASPDILEQPIERPIFITGLPRTGTTLLQRLFAQDTRLRSPKYWEMERPCPPPEKETDATDQRIQKAEKKLSMVYRIAPQLKVIHEMGALLPDECLFLFENDLISDALLVKFDLPEYYKWLNEQPLRPLYERHKKQLQLLQYRNRGERWVLKAPGHLRSLKSLMQVYPDACIIHLHRDPIETIPSAASLFMTSWSIFHDKVLPEKVGQFTLDLIGLWINQAMEDRKQAESNPDSKVRFIDRNYKDLVVDPIATMRDLYNQCGLTWSSSVEQQMKLFLAENCQHKHGKHQYSLEQFGLKEDQVRERFDAYNKRFLK